MGGIRKQASFIHDNKIYPLVKDEQHRNADWLPIPFDDVLTKYSRSYEEVTAEVEAYNAIQSKKIYDFGQEPKLATVSLWLENAMCGDLFVLIIDDDTGTDTELGDCIRSNADYFTRSKSGKGSHSYFGIRKDNELWDRLNILSGGESYISKTGLTATDGTKIDIFCDAPRFIYEKIGFYGKQLTDKTEVVAEILRHFEYKRTTENKTHRSGKIRKSTSYNDYSVMSKEELEPLMDTEQQSLTLTALEDMSSSEQNNWYSVGCDLSIIFSDNPEVGLKVYIWWSYKDYQDKFDISQPIRTWDKICDREDIYLSGRWDNIFGITTEIEIEPVPKREKTAEELAEEEILARGIRFDYVDDSPLVFRGVPTGWVVIENAKGDNEHFIDYEGKLYRPSEWLETVFPNYQYFKSVVEFDSDDIFWLSKSQRSKLQYHILALNFELLEIDEQDKKDFYRLAKSHDGETAKKWAYRCKWINGIEKMISFGATLDVRGKRDKETKKYPTTKGVWCYKSEFGIEEAIFESVPFTWEEWLSAVKWTIDNGKRLEGYRTFDERIEHYYSIKDELLKPLYYQDGVRLTLSYDEYKELEKWIFNYYLSDSAAIPYTGDINTALEDGFGFKIVYAENCHIVPLGRGSLRADGAMEQYNKEHAAEQSKRKIAAHGKLENFPDGDWTAKELEAWGFNQPNLRRYEKLGKIVVVEKRGNAKVYRKVSE